MLLELFIHHNKDVESLLGINKTKATLQKYKVTYTRLSDLMRYKYSISDINVKEVKYQFIVDFENYLRTECNCNANTTAKFIQFFKRMITVIEEKQPQISVCGYYR